VNDVTLLTAGQKVGASEAGLLAKLDIKPFSYGLSIRTVYDNGAVIDAKILEMTDDDILQKFARGVSNIAAIGLQVGYPTIASLPHSFARGYKNVASVSLATDYTFPKMEPLKKYLANPGAFVAPAATNNNAKDAGGKGKKEEAPAKVAPPPVAEEEEDVGGFGLFGDD